MKKMMLKAAKSANKQQHALDKKYKRVLLYRRVRKFMGRFLSNKRKELLMKEKAKTIQKNIPKYLAVLGANGLALAFLGERYREDTVGMAMSVILVGVSIIVTLKKEA